MTFRSVEEFRAWYFPDEFLVEWMRTLAPGEYGRLVACEAFRSVERRAVP